MQVIKHRLTPRAFLELKSPSAPHINPQGDRVVFSVNEADFEESRWVSHLWMADIPDGNARQLTFSYEGEHAPNWSPDGKWIAFVSARPDMTEPAAEEEDEDVHKEQVWLLPAYGGEAQRLTNTKEGVRGFEWAPDSKSIIYLAPEARPQPAQFVRDDAQKRKVDPVVEQDDKLRLQFWRIDLQEKKPELIYTGDFGVMEFGLSPDGTQLVFNSNATGDPNDSDMFDLFVLGIEQGEVRQLVDRPGGKFQPQWSPDGTQISFISPRDTEICFSQECAWVVSSNGGEPTNLFAQARHDVHDTLWERGGQALYALVADGVNTPLLHLHGGAITYTTPQDANTVCLDFDARRLHESAHPLVVGVIEDATTPPELYLLGQDGTRKPLTELNSSFVERYELPRLEVARWRNEGFDIEGVLVRPAESTEGPLPLVVQVHGGPKGHAALSLRSYYMHPVWAAEGYLVLKPNFRGSEGYGNEFAIANRRDLGGGDYRDIVAGIDMLVQQGLADPNRIGIMGGSYGGYMTNWAIGQTDRFAAAISMFGIFNLVTDYSNSEIPRWDPDYMGAYYWQDPDIYKQCSPATHVQNINTPVLIIHGESDSNTFIANSREMYRALKDMGKVVQFVHYPREGHGLREPNHKMDEMRRSLAWFDRYLKGAGHAQPVYRIGDRIERDGWELHVLRADDPEYAGRRDDQPRVLEVAFTLASNDPVEEGWRFALTDISLSTSQGACALVGVPVEVGGARMLVEGADLVADVQPDEDTGRLSFGMCAAFAIPAEGGVLRLQIANLPPVELVVGPKEPHPDEGVTDSTKTCEPEAAPISAAEEGPAQAPQRPQN